MRFGNCSNNINHLFIHYNNSSQYFWSCCKTVFTGGFRNKACDVNFFFIVIILQLSTEYYKLTSTKILTISAIAITRLSASGSISSCKNCQRILFLLFNFSTFFLAMSLRSILTFLRIVVFVNYLCKTAYEIMVC